MGFYVYELIDPRDGLPFYVGKGCNKRDAEHLTEAKRKDTKGELLDEKHKRILDITKRGLTVGVKRTPCEHEQEAYKKEQNLIEKWGRQNEGGILTNKNRGSKGPSKTKRIFAYLLNGSFVTEYDSFGIAANEHNVTVGNLSKVCDNTRLTLVGHQWRSTKQKTIDAYIPNERKRSKFVFQFSVDGKLEMVHKSAKEAGKKVGMGHSNITRACREAKLAGGSLWSYSCRVPLYEDKRYAN